MNQEARDRRIGGSEAGNGFVREGSEAGNGLLCQESTDMALQEYWVSKERFLIVKSSHYIALAYEILMKAEVLFSDLIVCIFTAIDSSDKGNHIGKSIKN